MKQRFFFGVLGVLSRVEAGRSDRGVACTFGSRPTALVHTTHRGKGEREEREEGGRGSGKEGEGVEGKNVSSLARGVTMWETVQLLGAHLLPFLLNARPLMDMSHGHHVI